MVAYSDEILGAAPTLNSGKDFIASFEVTGLVDIYQETLVGGVDYIISVLGASNGQTVADPGILVFNSSGQLVSYQLDSPVLGGADPLLQFRPPDIGIGQVGTYFIGVFDELQAGGRYTLVVDGAQPPVFFGDPGTAFL